MDWRRRSQLGQRRRVGHIASSLIVRHVRPGNKGFHFHVWWWGVYEYERCLDPWIFFMHARKKEKSSRCTHARTHASRRARRRIYHRRVPWLPLSAWIRSTPPTLAAKGQYPVVVYTTPTLLPMWMPASDRWDACIALEFIGFFWSASDSDLPADDPYNEPRDRSTAASVSHWL
jgi:hypothetical protein